MSKAPRDKFVQPAAGIRIVKRGHIGQALAAAQTALRLLDELHEDDPGDDEARFAPRLAVARTKAQDLVNAIQELSR